MELATPCTDILLAAALERIPSPVALTTRGWRSFSGAVMARGDTEFCRVEVDFILHDPRYLGLGILARSVYIWLWARAVKDRTETLKLHWSCKTIAMALHTRSNYLAKVLQAISRQGLIIIGDDGRITVCGVRGKHRRLAGWRDDPSDPYGAYSVGSKSKSKSKKREKTLSSENQKDQALVKDILDLPNRDELMTWWNGYVACAMTVPRLTKVGPARWRKFLSRCREGFWDKRAEIVAAIEASKFVQEQSWFSFDWLVNSQTNLQKLLEGNYRDKPKPQANKGHHFREDTHKYDGRD